MRYNCMICPTKADEISPGDYWTLNGFNAGGHKFWGTFCRDCFYKISQTPNHKITNQSLFNEVLVIYELKRSIG